MSLHEVPLGFTFAEGLFPMWLGLFFSPEVTVPWNYTNHDAGQSLRLCHL